MSKSSSRSAQQSVRLKRTTWPMFCTAPRSTCHQGCTSNELCVTELKAQLPFVLPSTARCELPPKSVLDWLVGLPAARLILFDQIDQWKSSQCPPFTHMVSRAWQSVGVVGSAHPSKYQSAP